MKINVLSIDLDWFNYVLDWKVKHKEIVKFFSNLFQRCSMPSSVAWMHEHQYLYPWVLQMLKNSRESQVNIVNIDEHHDFYGARWIKNFNKSTISCADFFAFMAHEGILWEYEWITNNMTHNALWGHNEVIDEVENCRSTQVQSMASNRRIQTWPREKVWSILDGRKFDAVALFDSPEYTSHLKTISRAAMKVFTEKGIEVRKHTCKKNFSYRRRKRLNMSTLFPK